MVQVKAFAEAHSLT
jgi:long-chain acyl-CoA synthetase